MSVKTLILEEVENASSKLWRTTTCAEINATPRCPAVFGGELVRDHLDLFNSFDGWLEAFACGAVVVIVQAINCQVVGVGGSACQGEHPRLFRRGGRGCVGIFGHVASGELLLGHPPETKARMRN